MAKGLNLFSWIFRKSYDATSVAMRSAFYAITWTPKVSNSSPALSLSQPRELSCPTVPKKYGTSSILATLLSQAEMHEDKTKLCEIAYGIENLVYQRIQPLRSELKIMFVNSNTVHSQIVSFVNEICAITGGYRQINDNELFLCLNGYDNIYGLELRWIKHGPITAWVSTNSDGKLILCKNERLYLLSGCRSLYELQSDVNIIPCQTERIIFRISLANLSAGGLFTLLSYSTSVTVWLFMLANGLIAASSRLSFGRRRFKLLNSVINQFQNSIVGSQALALTQILNETEIKIISITLHLFQFIRHGDSSSGADLQDFGLAFNYNSLILKYCLKILEDSFLVSIQNFKYVATSVEAASLILPSKQTSSKILHERIY